jgi:ATP-dependent protease ClpP protease subunit
MTTVQHIYCSAIISKKMCDALTSYVFSVSAAKSRIDEIVLYLVTGGGNPGSGMELYTFFKARPERTTIYNMSNVDSAGVLFFWAFSSASGYLPRASWCTRPSSPRPCCRSGTAIPT